MTYFRVDDYYFPAFLSANGAVLTLYPSSLAARVYYDVGSFVLKWQTI